MMTASSEHRGADADRAESTCGANGACGLAAGPCQGQRPTPRGKEAAMALLVIGTHALPRTASGGSVGAPAQRTAHGGETPTGGGVRRLCCFVGQ